jgi:hypothetical protein
MHPISLKGATTRPAAIDRHKPRTDHGRRSRASARSDTASGAASSVRPVAVIADRDR